jgi:hypothetical protein
MSSSIGSAAAGSTSGMGTVTTWPHVHFALRPASSPFTLNDFPHPVQANAIDIGKTSPRRRVPPSPPPGEFPSRQ